MLYDIRLVIDYTYSSPSDHTRNLMRLVPGDVAGSQTVLSHVLSITPPPDERREEHDFFGNRTTAAAWHAPIQSARMELAALVERAPSPEELDFSARLDDLPAEIRGVQSLTPDSPHHFLAPSPRVPALPAVTDFARAALRDGMTTLQAVVAVGRALHAAMTFDANATTVDTSPEEAFRHRHGVCQDFSHIMIAGLRGLGIPAGYASGFLRTTPPPGQPRLEGADAMHAWVRAWVGLDMGWVEFDPTNDQPAGVDYVTVAVGRDYADVAPVRGALRSAGEQKSQQSVDVVARAAE